MCSFIQAPTFHYNPNASAEGDAEFSGILEIHVHHARNIHNICIYDNQDVYAKFSLTYNPDDTISTRIIDGGGKNPEFEEDLIMKVSQLDAVLKCEIWMLSRAKNYMEDQLLGFALVSLSSVIGKGKVTQEFNLSSTDLFHSPAGTVKLTLCLNTNLPLNLSANPSSDLVENSSITSELVLLDRKVPEGGLDLAEYSRVEFPDINVFKENQKMISAYFDMTEPADLSRTELIGQCSFLHLGTMHRPLNDYEMAANSSEDHRHHTNLLSPSESIQNSGFLSSSASLSDDRSSVNALEKNNQVAAEFLNSPNVSISMESDQSPSASPETPTSEKEKEGQDEKESHCSGKEVVRNNVGNVGTVKLGQLFSTPLGNMNLDADQSAMQQQIVDMYMKSVQQFTESLAKMKLPMDLDIAGGNDQGDQIHNHNNTAELENKKQASSRVFYGSRAFF